jgi:hypothetical protein
MLNALAAFVGAFAALVALAEIQSTNKAIRYLGAFVVGAILAVVLGWLLRWVAHVLGAAA